MAARGIRRRRLLVSGFQYRLMAGNLLYLATVIVVFVGALFAPLLVRLDDESVGAAYRDDAARQLLDLYDRVWMALPFVVALCLLHSLVVSHRIAGPLVRFKQCFGALAQGDLALRVKIRGDDYLHDEADRLNHTIAALGARMHDLRESFADASHTLVQLEQALGHHPEREAIVLCGKLGTELDALGRRIAEFRIPAPAPAFGGADAAAAEALSSALPGEPPAVS